MEKIFYSLEPNEFKELIQDAVLQAIEEKTDPQQPDNEDQLIKVSDASKLLGVSKVTIHTWKRNRLIPFYRISNKIYFKKNELVNSLKKIRQGGKN